MLKWVGGGLLAVIGVVVLVIVLVGGGDDDDGDVDVEKTPRAVKEKPSIVPKTGAGLLTIDSKRATGTFPVAQANGAINRPARVAVRISSAPKRKATVNWNLTCNSGATARANRGTYTATPLNTRVLKLPIDDPDTCAFASNAQLSGKGRIKVTLLGRQKSRESGRAKRRADR